MALSDEFIVEQLGYDPRPELTGADLREYYLLGVGVSKLTTGMLSECGSCGARETVMLHSQRVCAYCRSERG